MSLIALRAPPSRAVWPPQQVNAGGGPVTLVSLRRDDLATGARAVRMPYIDQGKCVANELKYVDKVHLQNGYNSWAGGYLDTNGHSSDSGAKYAVSRRPWCSATWPYSASMSAALATSARTPEACGPSLAVAASTRS